MKMNDTVARIVDLMFENTEMNEEVTALRDEVMNNCQERYNDMVASGLSEDDAVGAVVESLKGMEDVIAQYRRKTHRHVKTDELDDAELDDNELDDEESGEQNMTFAASEVHRIDLALVNEDVTLEASDDDDYHVIWDVDDNPMVQVGLDNGVLKIERRAGDAVRINKEGRVEHHHRDDMSDFVRTENGKIEINMDSIDGMFKSIGQSMKNIFAKGNIRINVGFSDTGVTIQVPENAIPHVKLLTTSGDVDIQDVALAELNVVTTSGDINIDLDEDQYLKLVEVRTTSGDIEATFFAQGAAIGSTSGDVEVEGRVSTLAVNTISGDIDVRADVKNITFKAISGDVDLEFDSDEIRDVRGSTISGDIDIDLPSGMGFMNIHTSTRSGDVTTRCHTNGIGPAVNGSVTSRSGDITIS